MNLQQFNEIASRYRLGVASKSEIELLEAYYAAFEARPEVLEFLSEEEQEKLEAILFAELLQQLPTDVPVRKITGLRRRIVQFAAAVLILLGGGIIFLTMDHTGKQPSSGLSTVPQVADIFPGKDGAILTLADGKQIVLDSLGNGLVAEQAGSRVMWKEGALMYVAVNDAGAATEYNTMRTPRGKQFRMMLPDGTGVWLNAASSVRFATRFDGTERKVEVEGEVYFEIAQDPRRPFKVETRGGTEVLVLGTSFNISAYQDEPEIKTTLLEGKIRVKSNQQLEVLQPGQQVAITAERKLRLIKDVNVDEVMAWKNGLISLNDIDIKALMRQLERWYDVEVRYEGSIPDLNMKGELNKGVNLSAVINWLTEVGLNCRLEGRTLIVSGN